MMGEAFIVILKMSAPLLFASLGALVSEYTGSIAVFMEGAIIISAFFCAIFTVLTGSPFLAFVLASFFTVALLLLAAIFTIKTKANPFLTGLSVNLFAAGIVPLASQMILKKGGVISFEDFPFSSCILPQNNLFPFFSALTFSLILSLSLKYTNAGINLKYSGAAKDVLIAHGINPNRYKIFSWGLAAFFASCAGSALVFRLASYTPNISAGRGWTALAVVFLGNKKPIFCVIAVLIFSLAQYLTNIMQGIIKIPAGVMLAFPYILALLLFITAPHIRKS